MQTTFWLIVAGIAVVALVIVPLVYGMIEGTKSHVASTRKLYTRIADELGGTIVKGALPWTWAVRFPHGKLEAVLDTVIYASDSVDVDTRFQIPWPDLRLRCEIQARFWTLRLTRLLQMSDIATGDEQFDDAFLVTGNSQDAIRAMLGEAARSAVQELAKVAYDNRVYIAIQNGTFVVRKHGVIDFYGNLIRLARLSLELYENLIVASGIHFDDVVDVVDHSTRQGHCLVCGEPLAAQVVYCRVCQTPHHGDCWEYFGGCATYGCQSKKASPRKRTGGLVGSALSLKRR